MNATIATRFLLLPSLAACATDRFTDEGDVCIAHQAFGGPGHAVTSPAFPLEGEAPRLGLDALQDLVVTVQFTTNRSSSARVRVAACQVVQARGLLTVSSSFVVEAPRGSLVAYDSNWTGAHCTVPGLPAGDYTLHHGDLKLAFELPSVTQEICAFLP